jgi:hypothetical protein
MLAFANGGAGKANGGAGKANGGAGKANGGAGKAKTRKADPNAPPQKPFKEFKPEIYEGLQIPPTEAEKVKQIGRAHV